MFFLFKLIIKYLPFTPLRNITKLRFDHSRRSGTLENEVFTIPATAEYYKMKFLLFPPQLNIMK